MSFMVARGMMGAAGLRTQGRSSLFHSADQGRIGAHVTTGNRQSLLGCSAGIAPAAWTGLGLLARQEGRHVNTPLAQTYLCRSSPYRLTGYITYSDRVLWPMWAHLADAVREGGHRWKQTFGLEGPIFANFFRTEDDKREFL